MLTSCRVLGVDAGQRPPTSSILSGAAETEHHEIAVYEGLITHAEARGASAVAELLKRNLEDEQHTLQELQQVTKRIANDGVAVAA